MNSVKMNNKLTIEFDPVNGSARPDLQIEQYLKNCVQSVNDSPCHITIGNGIAVDYARLLVKRGELDHTKVVFLFQDQEITIDADGNIDQWPEGFNDHWPDVLGQLI